MYPMVANTTYYFETSELPDSSTEPCPTAAAPPAFHSGDSLAFDDEPSFGLHQPTTQSWQQMQSYDAPYWMDAPSDFDMGGVAAPFQQQQLQHVSEEELVDMEATLTELPLLDLPGSAGITSTPNGIQPVASTAALLDMEPLGDMGRYGRGCAGCGALQAPCLCAGALVQPTAPVRNASAVFNLDEPAPVAVRAERPAAARKPAKKKAARKPAKALPATPTSSGPPATVSLPQLTGDAERDAFITRVYTTNADNGNAIVKLPVVGKIPLDLFGLHTQVVEHGGLSKVLKAKNWKPIALNLGISLKACTDYGFRLRRHYERFLSCIDAADSSGTATPPLGTKRAGLGPKKGGGIAKRSRKVAAGARPLRRR
jgi:hypothetical protein